MAKRNQAGRPIVMYMREGWNASSSYYRLLQYKESLSAELDTEIVTRILVGDEVVSMRYDASGGNVSCFKKIVSRVLYNLSVYLRGIPYMVSDILNPPSCLVILRSLYPKYCGFPVRLFYSKLVKASGGVVWDFDDDIFANGEISAAESKLLVAGANRITVTHRGLGNLIPESQKDKVTFVHTTDGDVKGELSQLNEARARRYTTEVRLVWVASSSSLPYLSHIAETLDGAALAVKKQLGKRLTLRIVCNMPLEHEFQHIEAEFVQWGREIALRELEGAHIGIMPMDATRFARGKGGFKIVQYMAAGLPSVASAVGFNNEVVVDEQTGFLVSTSDEWVNGILRLSGDYSYWNVISHNARQRWDQRFSYEGNVHALAKAIKEAMDHE